MIFKGLNVISRRNSKERYLRLHHSFLFLSVLCVLVGEKCFTVARILCHLAECESCFHRRVSSMHENHNLITCANK